MNLSDLDAICCLLVWGGTIGFAVAMLCRGRVRSDAKLEPFPSLSFINALTVGILLTMILLAGNPDYLGGILWGLTLFLALAGIITFRFRMQKYGTIFATVGTVGLYLFFTIGLLDHGYTVSRHHACHLQFSSELKVASGKDKHSYPAGKMDANHPLLIANPALARAMSRLIRVKLWHTSFTTLYKTVPPPPFDFPGGTIADNRQLFYDQVEANINQYKESRVHPEAKP